MDACEYTLAQACGRAHCCGSQHRRSSLTHEHTHIFAPAQNSGGVYVRRRPRLLYCGAGNGWRGRMAPGQMRRTGCSVGIVVKVLKALSSRSLVVQQDRFCKLPRTTRAGRPNFPPLDRLILALPLCLLAPFHHPDIWSAAQQPPKPQGVDDNSRTLRRLLEHWQPSAHCGARKSMQAVAGCQSSV